MSLVSARVDLEACRHNCRVLRKAASGRGLFAVVKADGYGHGMGQVAEAVDSLVDGFCVFVAGDGKSLRERGVDKPVLVLGGVRDAKEAETVAASGLWLTVGTSDCLELACGVGSRLSRAFVKAETGMNRLGIPAGKVGAAIECLRKAGCADVALLFHYSDADKKGATVAQDEAIARLVAEHGLPYSASNTAATIQLPVQGEEFVRCGIGVYGCSPFPHDERPAASLGLRPSMSLCSRVISVRDVAEGGSVGYGSRWRARKGTKVAVVACGYSHGYPFQVPDGTPVWINGKERPVAGRVSMEMIMVECPQGDVKVGDQAQLWGDRVPAGKVAHMSGTICYELVSGLPQTVPRAYD